MNTKDAVHHVLVTTRKSKYRLARDLGVAPIMIDNYLNGTRMGVERAKTFLDLFNIVIEDVYDPVSHIGEAE